MKKHIEVTNKSIPSVHKDGESFFKVGGQWYRLSFGFDKFGKPKSSLIPLERHEIEAWGD